MYEAKLNPATVTPEEPLKSPGRLERVGTVDVAKLAAEQSPLDNKEANGSSRWWNMGWFRALALGLVVGGAVVLAIELHRRGHAQGDDFALYLRQARSIFEGDIGAVVADNRFAVLNSDPQFSPIAYP